MNIKTRILLFVIILQITGFTALLLTYNKRASNSVLNFNRHQVNTTLTATLHQLDATAIQMERTAAGLARGGEHFQEAHHRHSIPKIRNELQRLLLRTFTGFSEAEGGGIWYEPGVLSADEPRIAPYVYRAAGQLTFSWQRENPQYDYTGQTWYQQTIPAGWPRNEHRPQDFYWTAPYIDIPGSGQRLMTVAVPMYDDHQTLLGVATVNWDVSRILSTLSGLHLTSGTRVILYDSSSGEFLTEDALTDTALLTVAADGQSHEQQTSSGDYLFAARSKTGLIIAVNIPQRDLADLVSSFLATSMTINITIAIAFVGLMALALTILFRPFEQILERLRTVISVNRDGDRLIFRPIHYTAYNEFTPIVNTFNTLVSQITEFTDRLSHTNAQLQQEQRRAEELNNTLEQKVAARTVELAEKNREAEESMRRLKLTQQQLVTLEKHAALGDIVAGLAHEINTPLGISITAVSALEEQLSELEALYERHGLDAHGFREFIEFAREGVSITTDNLRRAADLISRFKQVAVDQASEQQRDFELCDYLSSILTSLRPSYKYRPVDVELQCSGSVIITSYPGAIAQIITNLLMNSLTHAFPPDEDDRRQRGHITLQVSSGEKEVCIRYQDNGKGMSEDIQQRLFTPFFTTRQQQGGSGLGTYIIHDLVSHQLHGRLEVHSAEGAGCEFIIYLPLHLSLPAR